LISRAGDDDDGRVFFFLSRPNSPLALALSPALSSFFRDITLELDEI
jgi:hypothetical protein